MATNKDDNEGQPEQNSGNGDDSDNFGLPDVEYKPIDREEEKRETKIEEQPEPESSSKGESSAEYAYDDEEPKSRAPLFIGLIIAVVVLVGGFLTYKYWYVPRAEKAKAELARLEAEKKKQAEEQRLAAERAEAERKRQDSIALANAKPAEGTIETLTDRTRRFFVVVTSDIDDDLLMDYAKKLSKKGVSTKIIPPFGDTKFFRLAIADFDTFSAAQSSADASKAEYGNGLWVMRY